MIGKYFAPALLAAIFLSGCQAPQGKFSAEQIAAMKSYGFTETNGDWSLGISDTILFDKMTTICVPIVSSKSAQWLHGWPPPVLPTAASKAILIITAKTATTKCYRLSAPTALRMPGPKGRIFRAPI